MYMYMLSIGPYKGSVTIKLLMTRVAEHGTIPNSYCCCADFTVGMNYAERKQMF